jgi:hypothetical protein
MEPSWSAGLHYAQQQDSPSNREIDSCCFHQEKPINFDVFNARFNFSKDMKGFESRSKSIKVLQSLSKHIQHLQSFGRLFDGVLETLKHFE